MPLLDPSLDAAVADVQERVAASMAARVGGEDAAGWQEAHDEALSLARLSPALAGSEPGLLEDVATEVANDLYLLGPLEDLLAAREVSDILVNGPDKVFVEVGGKKGKTGYRFRDDDHIMRIIQRVCDADNRRCDNTNPLCNCSLHRPGEPYDGCRVTSTCMPISVDHPTMSIRKSSKDKYTIEDLIELGTLDGRCAQLLEALVLGRMNVVIMGGTGSGKTTLLNVVSGFIPEEQRIITIEDTTELRLHHEDVVRMQARQANIEGVGEVTIRDLVINVLRQDPDRIIVGECRGGEAFDMLQAMGTGHDGSLTTIHANDARGAISRLQMMVQMCPAGAQLPQSAILQVITSAVDFVVCIKRFPDGSRKISEIVEVQGMQDDGHGRGVATLAPLVRFDVEGYDPDGRVLGSFTPTGEHVTAEHAARFAVNGVKLDPSWFRAWEM